MARGKIGGGQRDKIPGIHFAKKRWSRKTQVVIAMKKTWSIEERIFKEENIYERRMKMFEILKT